MKAVKARKDAISGESREGVESMLRGLPNGTVYVGHARFESPREVRVGDDVLTAERIFINVGGRASTPPIAGLSDVPYWTNSSMMAVDFVPPHLVVVGGSYIGLEFAQMYRRFGSAVTVVEMSPRLIAREDEDVSAAIREILEREGVAVRTGAECIAVEKAPSGVRVRRRLRGGIARRRWDAPAPRRRAPAQHGRPRARPGRRRRRRARLHHGRRPAPHDRPGHLGARRLQRPGRLHAHGVQRLRDRRREPPRRRPAARSATASRPTPSSSIRRSGAPA